MPSHALLPAAILAICPAFSQTVELNGIAATANGRVITAHEVASRMEAERLLLQLKFRHRGPAYEQEVKEVRNELLKELIDFQLILEGFERSGRKIEARQIDREIARMVRTEYGGEEESLHRKLKRSRLSMDYYRTMTEAKLARQSMLSGLFPKAMPPLPEEVRNEYEAIKTTVRESAEDKFTYRKIFIPRKDATNPASTPETQLALAEALVRELRNGADFAALAKQHSRDAFADGGGLQENVARRDLRPDFGDILFEAPLGEITGPIGDSFGFTIVVVINKELGPAPDFDAVRETVETQLRHKKDVAPYERWIESKRRAALIAVKPAIARYDGPDPEGKNITDVVIRGRDGKALDDDRLKKLLATKLGTPYRAERLNDDIKTLHATGLIDDIRVLVEPDGEGIKLIAEVANRLPVKELFFVGESVVSEEVLTEEAGLPLGECLSDARMIEARRRIERLYHGKGYADAVVSHRIQPRDEPGFTDLIFIIDEGGKSEIRKIRFEGNASIAAAELKKEIRTREGGLLDHDMLDRDLDSVLESYRRRGYLLADSPGIRREPAGEGKVDLVFPITEGERFKVASLHFSPTDAFEPGELHPLLTLKTGDACSSEKLREDAAAVRGWYVERGFVDALVTPTFEEAGGNRLKVVYQIIEGPTP